MLPAKPHTELLLVSICIPAVEEKWCEHVLAVQPSILPLPDTRVASQESQVTSRLPGECPLVNGRQEENSRLPSHPGAWLSTGARMVQTPF